MKTKNIIIVFLVAGVLLSLMLWGRAAQGNSQIKQTQKIQQTDGSLTVQESLYDFGTIRMRDGNVSKTFAVTNNSDEDVVLGSVTTSCMCTTAYLETSLGTKGPFGMPGHGGPARDPQYTLKARESVGVRVVYNPNAHGPAGVGPVDRFVYIQGVGGQNVRLEIKALVQP